jgi:hypothetical protein
MPIDLIDIPTAVASYLDTQVTTTVSGVSPKKPNQDVLTPGQDGTFTVTTKNAGTPDGVRLINVAHHLKIDDDSVAKLIVPQSTDIASFATLTSTDPLEPGSQQAAMFVRVLTVTVLGAGESQFLTIDVHCRDQGDAKITCHIHADVDQSDLFPTSQSANGERSISVL